MKWHMYNFLLALVSTFILVACSPGGWSLEISDGQEISNRAYLLVKNTGTKTEKRFLIASHCSKVHDSEAVYGECTHTIKATQSGKLFTLDAGEDVILVESPEEIPTILASVDYGCCLDPDIVWFYAEDGNYIGYVASYTLSVRTWLGNAITKTLPIQNGTEYKDKFYMILDKEPSDNTYFAMEYSGSNSSRKIPVTLSSSPNDNCAWYIESFTKVDNADRILLTLDMEHCDEDKVTYQCTPLLDSIECTIDKYVQ